MSKSYPIVHLGEVCDLQNGFAFKSSKFRPEGVPVLRISSIQNEQVCENRPVYVDPNDYDIDLTRYYVEKGNLLIAMSGATTGKVGFNRTSTRYLLNQRVGKFEPTKALDIKYLFYLLTTKVEENLEISSGAAQPNLSTKQIKEFQIPFPDISEQKRIVAILDEVFAGIDTAIANTQKNLANARELFESYLNSVFSSNSSGWDQDCLGNICDFLGGFAFKSSDTVLDSNVQLVRMGNLYKNALDLRRKPVFYPECYVKNYERYVLKKGDLIISLTGTIGKEDYGYTVEIPETNKVLLLNQRIAKVVSLKEDKVLKKYLLFYVRSKTFMKELYGSARGVRQANLSTVSIKKLSISFPPIEKQRELVGKFDELKDSVDVLEKNYETKLDSLNELKRSILQKAFVGELIKNEDIQRTWDEAVA